MSAPKVDVLADLRGVARIAKAASIGVAGNIPRIERAEAAIDAVAELIEASLAYFSGYCQDEADDDGVEFTGCSVEQHGAAKRLQAALARVGGDV